MRCIVAFVLALPCGVPAPTEGLAIIHIKADTPYNVTRDDMARLRELAAGVGWEFEPDTQTTEGLKAIGIRCIRCINVDPLPGKFDENGQFHVAAERSRLDAHLGTCRAIGASPHMIIATGMHEDLRTRPEHAKTNDESVMGLLRNTTFGPNDWGKFRNYCKACFQHVLIAQKFPDACFEVANEPDIGGAVVPLPPRPPMGSRKLYEAYWDLYRNVALAAREFETEHAGTRVTLGGPALAWAFTFRFGDFNWTERFLQDVRKDKTKLDFIGLHYYGNISPLTGESKAGYPSFTEMMRRTRQWRDVHVPGIPIWLTEWGATYHTSLAPESIHNGNHVGAAFAAAMLDRMLIDGVDRALYLVTTDLRQQIDGQWKDIWGWPSLFTNPHVSGTHPKAPYHVFQMLRRMAPRRIEADGPPCCIGRIASCETDGRVTVLLWHHSCRIGEFGPGAETGAWERVSLRVAGRAHAGPIQIRRWLVSRTISNARYLFERGETIDHRADLQQVDDRTIWPADGIPEYDFGMPPSSVTLVEFTPTTGTR